MTQHLRRRLRHSVYLPLSPACLRAVARVLRWLPKSAGAGEVRRILVPQPHNSLGDLALCIPFLDEVHRLWPDAVIDMIVGNAMTALFEGIPFVGRVYPFTPSRWRAPLARYQDTLRLVNLCRRFEASHDMALDIRWDSDAYGYMARLAGYLSGSAIRAGYSGRVDGQDPMLDGFLTHIALGGNGEHELLRKLRVLARAGLSPRHIEDSACLEASESLKTIAIGAAPGMRAVLDAAGVARDQPYAVLAPSASAAMRIWPPERLSAVARALGDSFGLQFVVMGSGREVALCESVAAAIPGRAVSVAGKTGVTQICALLAGASLFIGNDSGPAHIAGLLGTNTVTVSVFPASLNGLDHVNAPRRFRPCGPRVRVVQPERPLEPCKQVCEQTTAHCITQVTETTVLAACNALLTAAHGSLPPVTAELSQVSCG